MEFYEMPSSRRTPGKYSEINTRLAVRTLPANLQRVLLIGQRTAEGAAAEKTPLSAFSDEDAALYFGRGSVAHLMAKAAIGANPYVDLTIITLDDAGGSSAATGTIAITGPATSSGTLTAYVGAEKVSVAIAKDETANEMASALKAELDKHANLPATASVALNVVTLTAKNKGTLGNAVQLSAEAAASGAAAVASAMAGGATDPDISDALAVVAPERFHIVATAYNDQTSLEALRDHLDAVSGALEQRPGIGVWAMTGSVADAATMSGNINHGRMQNVFLRYASASKKRSVQFEIASAYASVKAREDDPARPLNGLEVKGIAAPALGDRFTSAEVESLLWNGVAPLNAGAGERVQVVRAVTSYTKNAQGIDDPALLDVTTITSMDYVREALTQRLALRFPRSKKTARVKDAVRSEVVAVLLQLEELEIVESVLANLDGVTVEDNAQDVNRLDVRVPADVVNGLHVVAQRIDLLL